MINGQPLNIGSYRPIITGDVQNKSDKKQVKQKDSNEFNQVLQSVFDVGKLKFSGHAKDRIQSRNVEFNEEKMERLNSAVERARSKGSKETLVLLDDVAMVVSVKNNTVITVMTGETLKENVFTNIDSAVLA